MKTSEKLYRLADYVEGQPIEEFDMSTVGTRLPCGSAFCLMGHATFIREFRAMGLGHKWVEDEDDQGSRVFNLIVTVEGGIRHYERAGAEFFGIDIDEAEELFSTWDGPSTHRAGKLAEVRALAAQYAERGQ
jgi:hypothetical protein